MSLGQIPAELAGVICSHKLWAKVWCLLGRETGPLVVPFLPVEAGGGLRGEQDRVLGGWHVGRQVEGVNGSAGTRGILVVQLCYSQNFFLRLSS